VDMMRSFGLKPGEKLVVQANDWRIVLMKESKKPLSNSREARRVCTVP